MDQTNWMAVIVMAIFAISICNGYRKGFFRLCVSFAATIFTVILVSILTPHVGEAIMKWTSVDEVIEKNCMEIFAPAEIAEKEDVSLQEQIQTIEQAGLPEFSSRSFWKTITGKFMGYSERNDLQIISAVILRGL